jgi:hypothetical protein
MEELGNSIAEYHIRDREDPQPAIRAYHNPSASHGSIAVQGTRALVEALRSSASTKAGIRSVQASDCGVAFLATTDQDLLRLLERSVRHVRSISFHGDLVSNDSFTWRGGELILQSLDNRRNALEKAITTGRLGTLIATAEDLEELDINLQCHEIFSSHVARSNLADFLGNYCWSQLRCLKLRGVWTSEDQLVDLLSRHRRTLQSLEIGDLVLKGGTWPSFFTKLKSLAQEGDLVSADGFELSGTLSLWTDHSSESYHWEFDAPLSEDETLGELLARFIFRDSESSILQCLEAPIAL